MNLKKIYETKWFRWLTAGNPVVADLLFPVRPRLVQLAVRFSLLKAVRRGQFKGPYYVPEKVLPIGITNACNAACVFCAYRLVKSASPRKMITMETLTKVLWEWRG